MRNNREFQYVSFCQKCGGILQWQKMTPLERREERLAESFLGYYFCVNCGSRDMRGVDQRWPGFVTCTTSTAAEVGMAADSFKRLYKKDSSLDFIINEGNNLISHPSSLDAWRFSYEEKKKQARQENVENYKFWIKNEPNSQKKSG